MAEGELIREGVEGRRGHQENKGVILNMNIKGIINNRTSAMMQ